MKKTIFISLIVATIETNIVPRAVCQGFNESPCNRYYETAIKFLVDTPVVHPFTISYDANTGRKGQVLFSSGNLQYCACYKQIINDGHSVNTIKDVWRFALRQIDKCTDGRNAGTITGNVWWDSVVRYEPGGINGQDSFYYVKRKSSSCKSSYTGTQPSKFYGGWIDLFGWGCSGKGRLAKDPTTVHFYPWDIGDNNSTGEATNYWGFGPAFYDNGSGAPTGWYDATTNFNRSNIDTNSGLSRYFDWGYANVIREYKSSTIMLDGKSVDVIDSTIYHPGTWRTLTEKEWLYLLLERKVNNQSNPWTGCYITDTTIQPRNGENQCVDGLLVYPDDFSFNKCGVRVRPFGAYAFNETTAITLQEWQLFEQAGCVFLPSDFARQGDGTITLDNCWFRVTYWSATVLDSENARRLDFCQTTDLAPTRTWYSPRNAGHPVRLVRDI